MVEFEVMERVDRVLRWCTSKELVKRWWWTVYLVILAVGMVIRLLIDVSQFKHLYIVSSSGILNVLYGNNGFNVYLVNVVLLSILSYYFKKSQVSLIVSNEMVNPYLPDWVAAIRTAAAKVVIPALWFVVFDYFKDLGSVRSGGGCDIGSSGLDLLSKSIKTSVDCVKYQGLWENNHCQLDTKVLYHLFHHPKQCQVYGEWVTGKLNISGHFELVVSLTSILITQFHSVIKQFNEEPQFTKAFHFVTIFTIFNLFNWFLLLEITSIFYHSLLEKLIGLTLGFVPLTVIFIIENSF